MKLKSAFIPAIFLLLINFSCTNSIDKNYIKTLKPTPFPTGDFEIAIPQNYQVIKSMGVDYDIFYVLPIDTTKKLLFTAGMYFGNNPSAFSKQKSGCNKSKKTSLILNTKSEWAIFDCNGLFFTETIIKNKYTSGGDDFIHAFGNATNEDDLEHILAVFSTLKNKKH